MYLKAELHSESENKVIEENNLRYQTTHIIIRKSMYKNYLHTFFTVSKMHTVR